MPVTDGTAKVISGQQQLARARYPGTPASELALFPRTSRNRDGKRPFTESLVSSHHRSWVTSLPPLRLDDGREFDKDAVTLYAYRHSFAQRHADAGTPVDVLRELMGHRSMSTTQIYYRNSRELHQPGEEPEVSRSQDRRNGVPIALMPAL